MVPGATYRQERPAGANTTAQNGKNRPVSGRLERSTLRGRSSYLIGQHGPDRAGRTVRSRYPPISAAGGPRPGSTFGGPRQGVSELGLDGNISGAAARTDAPPHVLCLGCEQAALGARCGRSLSGHSSVSMEWRHPIMKQDTT